MRDVKENISTITNDISEMLESIKTLEKHFQTLWIDKAWIEVDIHNLKKDNDNIEENIRHI